MDKPANPLSENMDMNKPSNAESQGESTPRQGTAQQEEMPEAAHMVGVEKPFSKGRGAHRETLSTYSPTHRANGGEYEAAATRPKAQD